MNILRRHFVNAILSVITIAVVIFLLMYIVIVAMGGIPILDLKSSVGPIMLQYMSKMVSEIKKKITIIFYTDILMRLVDLQFFYAE